MQMKKGLTCITRIKQITTKLGRFLFSLKMDTEFAAFIRICFVVSKRAA